MNGKRRHCKLAEFMALLVVGLPCYAAASSVQSAPERDLFNAPAGLRLIAPDKTGVSGSKTLYGATGPEGNWTIAQWDIPENLPPFSNGVSSNAFATVKWGNDQSISLEQNGKTLPCEKRFPSGRRMPDEFDLLTGPVGPRYQGYPAAFHIQATSLANAKKIILNATLLSGTPHIFDNSCKMGAAVSVTGLVFTNVSAQQTFFYQIDFNYYNVINGKLVQNTRPPNWFAQGQSHQTGHNGIFGFSDRVWSGYQTPAAAPEENTVYSIDILSRVNALISIPSEKNIDHNLGDWKLSGIYFGQSIFGHVEFRTVWSHLRLYEN